jgi:hypothetical protein
LVRLDQAHPLVISVEQALLPVRNLKEQ